MIYFPASLAIYASLGIIFIPRCDRCSGSHLTCSYKNGLGILIRTVMLVPLQEGVFSCKEWFFIVFLVALSLVMKRLTAISILAVPWLQSNYGWKSVALGPFLNASGLTLRSKKMA